MKKAAYNPQLTFINGDFVNTVISGNFNACAVQLGDF